MRAEDQHRVAGVEKRLAEELLERLCPGAGHHILGRDGDAVFLGVILGNCLAKSQKAQRRSVVRLPTADRLDPSGQGMFCAGKRAVADVQADDILARRLELARDGEHVKRGLGGEATGELAQRDGHCLFPIVWLSGRSTAGMMWLSTSSWQTLRWAWYASPKVRPAMRPQYWRTVK